MATNPDLTNGASQGRGGPAAADLMTRARNGDKQAWDALVERYASGHLRADQPRRWDRGVRYTAR